MSRFDTYGKYSGAEWLKGAKPESGVSEFGCVVADILGQAYRGLYHMPNSVIYGTDWSAERWIKVNCRGHLSTYDNTLLTDLVVLCHEACVRLEIEPCNMQCVKLHFSKRTRDGGFYDRHPSIDENVAAIKRHLIPPAEVPTNV